MAEENLIDDVHSAKEWVDAEYPTWESLRDRLQLLEKSYRNRTGEFAGVPTTWPQWVQDEIAAAEDSPGHELLDEVRALRRK